MGRSDSLETGRLCLFLRSGTVGSYRAYVAFGFDVSFLWGRFQVNSAINLLAELGLAPFPDSCWGGGGGSAGDRLGLDGQSRD